jgi:hypothetical protein
MCQRIRQPLRADMRSILSRRFLMVAMVMHLVFTARAGRPAPGFGVGL